MRTHPLKQLRERLGWTQERLGSELNATKSTVSRWENGERVPRPRKAKDIEQRTGVPATEILTYEKEVAA